MLPLLKYIADGGEYTIAGSRDVLAKQFELTEEEINKKLPSGVANAFYNRLAWAKIYLERAGLISKVRHGVFKISPSGQSVLSKSPEKINISYLEQFPEFAAFKNKTAGTEASDPTPSNDQDASVTPEEALDLAYKKLRDDLANQLLSQIKSSHPSFFEKLVVDLMLKMGFGGPNENAGIVTPYGGDGGIDGIINQDQLGLDVIYLQAKRWENTVGRPEIQKFVGALFGKKAKKGVFLTTSSFSAEASDYASSIDAKIVLIDGAKLAQLMIDFGVGVSSSQTYIIKRIDHDYFESE
jgi:restriction system protein